jgi:hypothetical protein
MVQNYKKRGNAPLVEVMHRNGSMRAEASPPIHLRVDRGNGRSMRTLLIEENRGRAERENPRYLPRSRAEQRRYLEIAA